eukprot:TRINITY_DN7867_c0_g1_i2.p1 TRINITY_DN7867_c0_g1~~TRINITY_DN7867_c0_g1_i2.p1  ORF type:complete len:153 (-),score=24.31 TRINITY_DN7867_c0_g1_i2:109-567(-)
MHYNLSYKQTQALVRSVVYGGNCLWHAAAFYYFCFKSRGILNKYTTLTKGDNLLARDVMKFLGAFNLSMVILCLLRIRSLVRRRDENNDESDKTAMTVLGTANLSQFVMDMLSLSTLRWRLGGLDIITVMDGIFSVVDFGYVYLLNKSKTSK